MYLSQINIDPIADAVHVHTIKINFSENKSRHISTFRAILTSKTLQVLFNDQ